MITPVNKGVQHIRFSTLGESEFDNYYINIIAHNSNLSGITLDGNNISNQFILFDTTYSFARIPITNSIHVLEST